MKIIESLFDKMTQNLRKTSVFGLAVHHKDCVVGFHGCTRMQLLLWQKSWRIVEQKLSGEFEGQGNNNRVSKVLCNLCMGKKWVFLWTAILYSGNIKQDFCNACFNDLWRSFQYFQTNGGMWGHSVKEIFLTVYAILLCNSSTQVMV